MQGQLSIFDFLKPQEVHAKLLRKSEYECTHCTNCGFEEPYMRLVGDWPEQEEVLTKKCPNCKAIIDIPEEVQQEAEKFNSRHKCKHSGHKCNKEELWKIAAEEDPFCPKVCCRFCNTKMCGARCNGSQEPKMQQCSKKDECEAYPVGCGGTIEPCRFGGPFKWSREE